MRRAGLTRRSVSFMVPFLSLPTFLLSSAAFASGVPTPETTEGPYYPQIMPKDANGDLVKIENSDPHNFWDRNPFWDRIAARSLARRLS